MLRVIVGHSSDARYKHRAAISTQQLNKLSTVTDPARPSKQHLNLS